MLFKTANTNSAAFKVHSNQGAIVSGHVLSSWWKHGRLQSPLDSRDGKKYEDDLDLHDFCRVLKFPRNSYGKKRGNFKNL